jgi:5,10-methylenetetrahydromethanopterin reductase
MQLGLSTHWRWGEPLASWRARVRTADEQGFSFIGVSDTQSVAHDTYTTLALLAGEVDAPLIGPMVTNAATRHPAVTASAIASIDAISGGRAVLSLGRGASAVRNVGSSAASVADTWEYVRAVVALLDNQPASWNGSPLHSGWVPRRIPVFVSASGPRMLDLAGALCDGVVLAAGIADEPLRRSIATLRSAAVAHGRDPASVEVWASARVSVRDDPAEAVEDLKPLLASAFHNVAPGDPDVPEHLRGAFEQLRRRYDGSQHGAPGVNGALIDDLGLTGHLVERFAIAGPPERCARRLREVAAAGVDRVIVNDSIRAPTQTLVRLGAEVAPLLADRELAGSGGSS